MVCSCDVFGFVIRVIVASYNELECVLLYIILETEGLRDLARDYVTKWVVSPFWESRRKKVREEGPFSDPQC